MLFESLDDNLYISDNPVIFYNENNDNERGNLGINSKGVQIYLPISSSLVLALLENRKNKKTDDTISNNKAVVLFLNNMQINNADRFIFSKFNNFELVYKVLNI